MTNVYVCPMLRRLFLCEYLPIKYLQRLRHVSAVLFVGSAARMHREQAARERKCAVLDVLKSSIFEWRWTLEPGVTANQPEIT